MHRPAISTAVRVVGALLVVLVGVTVVLVVVSVRGGPEAPAPAPPPAAVTTLAELEGVPVARAAFCDRVAAGAVRAALDAPVDGVRDYDNGDTAQVGPGTNDVAHEFGCTWTSTTGTVARAWVFAPPVTRARAKILTRADGGADGCSTYAADGFGSPSVAFTCTGDGLMSSGHGGLFGDAWLTCTVAGPVGSTDATALRQRADRWCVGAALGAASPSPR